MANQAKGEFKAHDLIMAKYLQKVQTIVSEFKYFDVSHIFWIKMLRTMLFLDLQCWLSIHLREYMLSISRNLALTRMQECIK